MAAAAYIVSVLTTTTCAILLARAWRRSKTPLLGAASFCFACLALNDALLLVDELVFPSVDLLTWRALPALLGLLVLVVSLTQEET